MFRVMKKDINDTSYLCSKLPTECKCFTKHALARCNERGLKFEPAELNEYLTYENFLEFKYDNGNITYLFRIPMVIFNLCVVLNGSGKIVSVWKNHLNDNHDTLDLSTYRRNVNIKQYLH